MTSDITDQNLEESERAAYGTLMRALHYSPIRADCSDLRNEANAVAHQAEVAAAEALLKWVAEEKARRKATKASKIQRSIMNRIR